MSASTPSPFDLTGRVALVTGARRGIGRGMAEALARAGADIIAVSANQEPDGGDVGQHVRGWGREFRGLRADFTDRDSANELAEQLAESNRPIDILVCNAGTIRREPAATHPIEWWDEVIEVNLSSQFRLAQSIGRQMLDRGNGKIIFTASLLSFQGGINVPGYAAAKSGISGLTKALANEWAPHGVNVNAIAPGYIDTDNTAALRADRKRSATLLDRIPAGRWGTPADLGGATVFLASAASDYVSGITLPVDGGWLGR